MSGKRREREPWEGITSWRRIRIIPVIGDKYPGSGPPSEKNLSHIHKHRPMKTFEPRWQWAVASAIWTLEPSGLIRPFSPQLERSLMTSSLPPRVGFFLPMAHAVLLMFCQGIGFT